jgi:hypothetical protein
LRPETSRLFFGKYGVEKKKNPAGETNPVFGRFRWVTGSWAGRRPALAHKPPAYFQQLTA